MVMKGIEHHLEHVVAFHVSVAPEFGGNDARRIGIKTSDREVDVMGVVKNPDLGALRSILAFMRVTLAEVGDGLCQAPASFLKKSIDRDWFIGPNCHGC